jgi:hypothetical protein
MFVHSTRIQKYVTKRKDLFLLFFDEATRIKRNPKKYWICFSYLEMMLPE